MTPGAVYSEGLMSPTINLHMCVRAIPPFILKKYYSNVGHLGCTIFLCP